ncbi:MAG TPA: cardiolipin synthase [Arenimonas sp.]|nr:cardiolipin synthase [Arenimonas sp.]
MDFDQWWHAIAQLQTQFADSLFIFWLIYFIILSAWILLQKREPIATLSWILSLALLPYIGFIIYHFLGPTRIKRQSSKRLRAKSGLMPLIASNSTRHASELMKLNAKSSGFAPSSAKEVILIHDGAGTFEALEKAIELAEHHIHLEYYIFEPDTTGTRIRDALIAQAMRGVHVRLLLDRLGSKKINETFLRPMRKAGIEILFFHPFFFKHIWRPQINIRSHRKIVVIDGSVGFTGGINITDEENKKLRDDAYEDLHFKITGEIVRWLQLAFFEDWHYAGGQIPILADYWPTPTAGDIATQVLAAGPDTPWEPIHRAQVFAINNAKKKIVLATPYFVPSNAALMALGSAALRGIDVVLIVPKRSDSYIVSLATQSYFDELSLSGVRIYQYPHMLHTKALLIDEDAVIVGSSNFDQRSFRLNFELSLLIEDNKVAGQLARILFGYVEQSQLFDPKLKIPLHSRLAIATARLLSPLL